MARNTTSAVGRPSDTPSVIALPPLIFLGALGPGLLLHWLMPVQPLPPPLARILAAALFVVGGVVGIWGMITMKRAGTNLRPDHPSIVVVKGGPFRFSRNPLYLSVIALYLGITLIFDALWPLLTLAPALAVLHWGVVLREERYLEAKFGDEYRAYKARVRRWI